MFVGSLFRIWTQKGTLSRWGEISLGFDFDPTQRQVIFFLNYLHKGASKRTLPKVVGFI